MKLTINGVEKEVEQTKFTYHDIVRLAFGQPMMRLQTITYFHRNGNVTISGEIAPFEAPVCLPEGTIITVGYTGLA
jgi:hypothetical protein